MMNIVTALESNSAVIADFHAKAAHVPKARWAESLAPGKWSPAQVAEHVALAYETSDALLRGPAPGGAPRFLRPLLRGVLMGMVLRREAFPRGSRSPKIMQPATVPAERGIVLERLHAAAAAFDAHARAHGPAVEHPFFGAVPLENFIRFQEIHTRHHAAQLPG